MPAETTDRLIVFGTNGRFYTIGVDRLPGGRGHGEPLRLMIDLPNEHDIVAMFPHRPGMELLVAADDGRGFVVDGEEALAQTRAGKQVLTPAEGAVARACAAGRTGDAVAFVGDNRKMLIFSLDDIPLMTRGRGVILQRYRIGRARRLQSLPPRRRPLLAPGRKPHPHRNEPRPVARLPRRRRPPRPQRLPALQPLRVTISWAAGAALTLLGSRRPEGSSLGAGGKSIMFCISAITKVWSWRSGKCTPLRWALIGRR